MRYARALFEYALENKVEEVLFSEMKTLQSSLSGTKVLRVALDNPVLDINDKLELMKLAVGGKPSDAFVRFAQLLLQKRREDHLQTISLIYLDLYRKHKNINVGKLVTATPVKDDVISRMKSFLQTTTQSGTLEFESIIDPSIDGGFMLYIDTYRLDASVATQLKKIKQQLVAQNGKSI